VLIKAEMHLRLYCASVLGGDVLEKSGAGPAHIHVRPPLYCSPFTPSQSLYCVWEAAEGAGRDGGNERSMGKTSRDGECM